jgi:protease II
LVDKRIAHENKLAAWGYSAGGLLVAAVINACPELFRAAVLKVIHLFFLIFIFLSFVFIPCAGK